LAREVCAETLSNASPDCAELMAVRGEDEEIGVEKKTVV